MAEMYSRDGQMARARNQLEEVRIMFDVYF
jgi:hypothetical protein